MNDNTPPPPTRIGILTGLFIRLAGGDVDTARRCPPRDLEVFRILALIMLATAAYQTAVLSLIGHRVFSEDGSFRPLIVLVAALIALFIMLIDSYAFMRAGWLSAGEADLARAGLQSRQPWSTLVKKGVSLTVRLVLAIALAELLAIFLALIIFSADIRSRHDAKFLRDNAPVVGTVTALVDAGIRRDETEVTAQAYRVVALSGEVTRLRESAGGASANPQVRAAQAEVERYVAAKAKAEDDVRSAEAFAAGELSGARGPGQSGQAGRGPRRKAAEEMVASARARLATATRDLEAARARLNDVRKEVSASSGTTQTRASSELPRLETQLAAEDAKLREVRDRLAALVEGRGRAIRHGIESTPEHVPYDGGLIAQIRTLEQITDGDRKLQALIFLIGLVGFGFELAGVLAKLTTHTPTTYAPLTVRNNYLTAVRIVEEMAGAHERQDQAREVDSMPEPPADSQADLGQGEEAASNDNGSAEREKAEAEFMADAKAAEVEPPVKRPRGRPRKSRLN